MKFKGNIKIDRRLRALSLCLSLALSCAMLFSCAGSGGSENPAVTDKQDFETGTPAADTNADYTERIVRGCTAEDAAKELDLIGDADFDGAATVIATCNYEDILCPSEAADEISATALKRNKYKSIAK